MTSNTEVILMFIFAFAIVVAIVGAVLGVMVNPWFFLALIPLATVALTVVFLDGVDKQ